MQRETSILIYSTRPSFFLCTRYRAGPEGGPAGPHTLVAIARPVRWLYAASARVHARTTAVRAEPAGRRRVFEPGLAELLPFDRGRRPPVDSDSRELALCCTSLALFYDRSN